MLEHDTAPWVSMANAYRACKEYGYLIVTARGYNEQGYYPVHNWPGDHWRFSLTGMKHLLEHTGWSLIDGRPDPECPGVLAMAQKLSS